MFPGSVLPPQPIVTRWGTWIDAAVYYAKNFDNVEAFLVDLDSNDAKAIRKAKSIISDTNLKKDLAFIKTNFECLVTGVMKLQEQGLPLVESLKIFESVRTNLRSMLGRTEFVDKFDRVVARNKGFSKLQEIASILNMGKSIHPDEFIDSLSPDELSAFLYAPITSCDVERTFSKYKQVLGDQRRSFLFENLKMHVLIFCNHFD